MDNQKYFIMFIGKGDSTDCKKQIFKYIPEQLYMFGMRIYKL